VFLTPELVGVVSFTPWPLYLWRKSPKTGLDDVEKRKISPLPRLKLRPLSRPARSQLLHFPTIIILFSILILSSCRKCKCFPLRPLIKCNSTFIPDEYRPYLKRKLSCSVSREVPRHPLHCVQPTNNKDSKFDDDDDYHLLGDDTVWLL
jgi:hypothetical protein